jgi:hypothetical protein
LRAELDLDEPEYAGLVIDGEHRGVLLHVFAFAALGGLPRSS